MPKSSKGATALSVKPILKLASVTSIRKTVAPIDRNAKNCLNSLRDFIKEAEAGDLQGIVMARIFKDGCVDLNLIGSANESLFITRGIVAALEDYVKDEVYE